MTPLGAACLVGTVTSHRRGVISAYRFYEFGLSHRVFKRAQNVAGVVAIAPGCASLYRSDVLKQLDFSCRTLTEDFDLTLQIHHKKLGRVVYVPKAKVITQDPPTFLDYWKQVTRWHTGFWQNIFLHKVYHPTKLVNLEIALLAADGLGWLAILGLAVLNPLLFAKLGLSSALVASVLAVIVLLMERQAWAIRYIPAFFLFQAINLVSYFYSFFRALGSGKRRLSWQKVTRYSV